MTWLKKTIRSFRPSMEIYETLILSRKYLRRKGWFHSRYYGMPVNEKKQPIPWLTYPAIHFLQERLKHTNLAVFEYGSGNSTIWLSSRVGKVVSIEYNSSFYEFMKLKLENMHSIDYRLAELGKDYWQQITEFKDEFDIIIIDGRERVQCTLNCLDALKDSGVIIWDNSDREEYLEAYDFLDAQGFKKIDFQGHGPIGHVEWKTSIYYKSENCLGI